MTDAAQELGAFDESDDEPSIGLAATLPTALFEQFVSVLNTATDDPLVTASENGLAASETDPAKVMFVDAHLSTAAFDAYEAADVPIGLKAPLTRDALDVVDVADLHLEYDSDEKVLDLGYGGATVTITCHRPGSLTSAEIPDLTPDAVVSVPAADLREAITLCHSTTKEHITLTLDDDVADLWINVDSGGCAIDAAVPVKETLTEPGESIESVYPRDYLKDVVDALPAGRDVALAFGDEYPMRLSWEFIWDGDPCGTISMGMAPRMEGGR